MRIENWNKKRRKKNYQKKSVKTEKQYRIENVKCFCFFLLCLMFGYSQRESRICLVHYIYTGCEMRFNYHKISFIHAHWANLESREPRNRSGNVRFFSVIFLFQISLLPSIICFDFMKWKWKIFHRKISDGNHCNNHQMHTHTHTVEERQRRK